MFFLPKFKIEFKRNCKIWFRQTKDNEESKMLVRITNCCHMGCNHCMVDATPDGEHMSLETFMDVIKFTKDHGDFFLMLSGGEPLDHPYFFEFANIAKKFLPFCLILSNGMFLNDEDLRERVLALNMMVQITNDPRYYPHTIPYVEHPCITYEDTLHIISPFGRAVLNKIPVTQQFPMCFNLRSASRALRSFADAILMLRNKFKMCNPSINVDGTISAGESPFCYKIGTVKFTDEELLENILTMKCNKCGLERNLSSTYKNAIGLSDENLQSTCGV